MSKQKFIFLDRDGTIIIDKDYLAEPGLVEFLPHTLAGLKKLATADFKFIIVTNQSGIGRGKFTHADMHAVNAKLLKMLEEQDIFIEKIYYCPHAPNENCPCRKPRLGQFLQAATDFEVDIDLSAMIGDKQSDIEFGQAAGLRPILVRTGYGKSEEVESNTGVAVFDNLEQAADWLISLH